MIIANKCKLNDFNIIYYSDKNMIKHNFNIVQVKVTTSTVSRY